MSGYGQAYGQSYGGGSSGQTTFTGSGEVDIEPVNPNATDAASAAGLTPEPAGVRKLWMGNLPPPRRQSVRRKK